MNRSKVRVAIFIYWSYVLIVTFHPFELSPDFAPSLSHVAFGFKTLMVDGWNWLGPTDFVLNILLFVPCGFLLFCLWEERHRSKIATIVTVTMCGALASFSIEWGQVFASRNSSAMDVVSNTLGTAAGAYSYTRCKSGVTEFIDDWSGRIVRSKAALCCALAFAMMPLAYSFEQSSAPFWRWDSRLTLQLGNEPAWNRPWLGKIYMVALYRRALSAEEINTNFAAGFSTGAAAKRARKDLIALYTFSEGSGDIARDSSKFGPALDLKMSRNAGVRWLADANGIEIARRSIVKSKVSAAKLVQAVRATDELSVEVWVAPQDTVQSGPARIVSLSRNSGARNFTLGQKGANIQFRLRTPVSGSNGAPVLLRTNHGILSTDDFHIVATYKGGIERLYVNGGERPEKLNLATDGIAGFATRKTLIAKFAYSFVYFFPASMLLFACFSKRLGIHPTIWILLCAIAVGFVGVIEIVQAFVFDRAIDFPIIICGVLISVVGAACGRIFVGEKTIAENNPI